VLECKPKSMGWFPFKPFVKAARPSAMSPATTDFIGQQRN
jgi:hypothetical protein